MKVHTELYRDIIPLKTPYSLFQINFPLNEEFFAHVLEGPLHVRPNQGDLGLHNGWVLVVRISGAITRDRIIVVIPLSVFWRKKSKGKIDNKRFYSFCTSNFF